MHRRCNSFLHSQSAYRVCLRQIYRVAKRYIELPSGNISTFLLLKACSDLRVPTITIYLNYAFYVQLSRNSQSRFRSRRGASSLKRRRWRMKRGEDGAAVKIARRPKPKKRFWEPQETLTFVDCDKSKQKHACACRPKVLKITAQLSASPLLGDNKLISSTYLILHQSVILRFLLCALHRFFT